MEHTTSRQLREAPERSKSPELSVGFIAFMCSTILIAYVGIGALLKITVGALPPKWLTVLVLLVAIHLCAWYLARRAHRPLRKSDLVRLSVGCAIAFCLIDVGLILALQWAGLVSAPTAHATAKAILAVVIDALIVIAIVFVTVPLAAKFYTREVVA